MRVTAWKRLSQRGPAEASPPNERELFLRERQAHVHAGFRHLVHMQEEMEIQHGYCRVSHSIRGKARKRGGCRARPQRSVGSSPGGAGNDRLFLNSPGTLDVRRLRCLPRRRKEARTLQCPLAAVAGESEGPVCRRITGHGEGCYPGGQASWVESA